ncbi:MAG: GtrA family protein [Bacilli bacterium]
MSKKITSLYKKYKEIINYIIVGGLTTVISIASYNLFVFKFDYMTSTIMSWIVAVSFAYFANKYFVFEVKENKNILLEIFQFFKYRLLSLGIEMISMYLLVSVILINDRISKILVQFIIVVLNYIFSKLFVFKKKKVLN